jgi:hypothetical protein
MDVSNRDNSPQENEPDLIRQLVSLTGLPEHLAYREVDRILEANGQKSAEVKTLDDLRAAMLAYLEAMQSELMEEASQQQPHD